jgi:hypothetical protein
MPTPYTLINNGDSGSSVRTTLNSLLTDVNTGLYIGPTGATGLSGTSGISGSSGTSGVSGSSGTTPTGQVRGATASPNSVAFIWSGTQAQYTALGTYNTDTIYFVE